MRLLKRLFIWTLLPILFTSCAPKLTNQEMLVMTSSNQVTFNAVKDGSISREEQIKIFKTLENASTKNYKGYTQEELMSACYKVLKLIDPNDSTFTHTSETIVMKRTAVVSIVILTGVIHDYWVIKASHTDDGIAITLRMARKTKDSDLFFSVNLFPEKLDSINIPIQNSVLYEGEYYTFFKRLDYFLGVEPVWYDCKAAEVKVASLGMPKNVRNMCYLCDDLKP